MQNRGKTSVTLFLKFFQADRLRVLRNSWYINTVKCLQIVNLLSILCEKSYELQFYLQAVIVLLHTYNRDTDSYNQIVFRTSTCPFVVFMKVVTF